TTSLEHDYDRGAHRRARKSALSETDTTHSPAAWQAVVAPRLPLHVRHHADQRRCAPMRQTTRRQGSESLLRQAGRVPFCTTVSPACKWISFPSSNSSQTSPEITYSKSIVFVVCMPGLSTSIWEAMPGNFLSSSARASCTSRSFCSAIDCGATVKRPNRNPPTGGK